jgi:hypothetical protein
MTLPLRPRRGGFLRPFGCGEFVRDFLMGEGPHGSPRIDPEEGAPQAVIFKEYKIALLRATSMDRAIRAEERTAKKEGRNFDPDNVTELANAFLARMPYKANGCRYHSFVNYFSRLQKLKWVELTGREEFSEFQFNYPSGQPRKYFRLTEIGRRASRKAWSDPRRALYG